MKFTEVKEVPKFKRSGVKGNNMKFIEDFANSGLKCVKIEEYPHKTASSCQWSLIMSIKRLNKPHIKVHLLNNEVYIVNTLIN